MFTWSLSLLVAIHPSRCQNIRAQHDDELYMSAVGANWCCNWGCELGCFWKQLLNWVVTRMHDDELLYQWRLIGVAMLSEAQEVSGHLSRCAPLSFAAGGEFIDSRLNWHVQCAGHRTVKNKTPVMIHVVFWNILSRKCFKMIDF